jgi:hypothetical protein
MPLVSVDQIIGKNLIAKKPVKIYNTPEYFGNSKVVTTVKPGLSVGVVDSWVGGTEGKPLYFMFIAKFPINKPYYAKFEQGAFDYDILREQGVKTVKEQVKEKENENKSTSDKIFEFVKKYAIWAGVGFGSFIILKEILKKK